MRKQCLEQSGSHEATYPELSLNSKGIFSTRNPVPGGTAHCLHGASMKLPLIEPSEKSNDRVQKEYLETSEKHANQEACRAWQR